MGVAHIATKQGLPTPEIAEGILDDLHCLPKHATAVSMVISASKASSLNSENNFFWRNFSKNPKFHEVSSNTFIHIPKL
jgi:hypothetical protein